MIVPSRRAFLGGGLALVAAPAIARVSSLMPVKIVDERVAALEWLLENFESFCREVIREAILEERQCMMSTSFNGRTPPFDGGDFGSNPRVFANE